MKHKGNVPFQYVVREESDRTSNIYTSISYQVSPPVPVAEAASLNRLRDK